MTPEQKERFAPALARLNGDESILSSMASITVSDSTEVLRQMDSSTDRNDLDSAAESAHSLKGMLSTFETESPVAEIQSVIQHARDGDTAAVHRLNDSIRPRIRDLLDEVAEIADEE